jgi:formate C-acetyltransferase
MMLKIAKGGSKTVNERIKNLRKNLFACQPSIDINRARLITQSYRETEAEPMVLRRGKAIYKILTEMPIAIHPGELIVGSPTVKPRAAQIFPEVQAGWLAAEMEQVGSREWDPLIISEQDKEELVSRIVPYWQGKTINERVFIQLPEETKHLIFRDPSAYPTKPTAIIDNFSLLEKGIGTVAPNYKKVLTKGIKGILAEAENHMEKLDLADPEDIAKHYFLKSVCLVLKGVAELAARYGNLAADMAREEQDPSRKEELLRIADICRRVPYHPPGNFWEAVQSFWFTHLAVRIEESGHSLSPGRFDQTMYPFYRADPEKDEVLKRQRALELIECLFIKFSELMLLSRTETAKFYTGVPQWQNLNLGGRKKDGQDATNDISYLCLEAMGELRLVQPDISVRVHEGTAEPFLLEACRLSRLGTGHPKFYNEDLIAYSMAAKGLTLDEARDFVIMGCVEPRVQEKEGIHLTGGFLNLPAAVELVLNNGKWPLTGKQIGVETGDPRNFTAFEAVMDAYRRQIAHLVKHLFVVNAFAQKEYQELLSAPFLSALTEGCIERGRDLQHGGAIYNFGPAVNEIGIADTIDSLFTIKKLVFERKLVTMTELLAALAGDFGPDGLKVLRLIDGLEKFGNDNEEVDDLAREAIQIPNQEIMKYRNIFGGQAQSGLIQVTAGIPFGKVVGALPNGRRAGEPFADGVSPSPGRDKYGPTAILKSVSRLDAAKLRNGVLLNMRLDPNLVKTVEGLNKFASFIRAFCASGCWHIQFNFVNSAVLRDAQENPRNYEDLLVRVAGYSAYFAQLHKEVQDDIIRRSEYQL